MMGTYSTRACTVKLVRKISSDHGKMHEIRTPSLSSIFDHCSLRLSRSAIVLYASLERTRWLQNMSGSAKGGIFNFADDGEKLAGVKRVDREREREKR
jgi:hypothetical protein